MPDEDALTRFRSELTAWRDRNPGWTEGQQLAMFPPHSLWRRAGGGVTTREAGSGAPANGELYRRLMVEAGYLVKRAAQP